MFEDLKFKKMVTNSPFKCLSNLPFKCLSNANSRHYVQGERRWVKSPKDPKTGLRGPDVLCELVQMNSVKFTLQPLYPRWRRRWKTLVSALFIILTIAVCGGGGGEGAPVQFFSRRLSKRVYAPL